MFASLSSLVPNADDLLALEVEVVAGVLLAHLNSYSDDSGNNVVQRHDGEGCLACGQKLCCQAWSPKARST